MPLYEFDCLNCDKELTMSIPIDQETVIMCPDCGEKMVKVYSFGISFKGKGFYSTDNK